MIGRLTRASRGSRYLRGATPQGTKPAWDVGGGGGVPARARDAPAARRPQGTSAGRRPLVLLVAGEASGDLHGADLVGSLRELVPDVEVVGLGGERLRGKGMRTVADAADVATVGVVEGIGRLRKLITTYRTLARMVRRDRPDLVILIDFPEFNLRLARIAARSGIPVFYYIAPQVWAWRRGRIRTIARRVDALALVFPFEARLYKSTCASAEFVGHPLLDRVRTTRGRAETFRIHGLDEKRTMVALLPGSRSKEVRYVLPRLLAAAEILGRERHCQFVLALADTVASEDVDDLLARCNESVRVISGDAYNLIKAADLVLVASGTATLETALLERPMVIVYRLSTLTYALARFLVGVEFIGIPNIVRGCEVVPELIQGQATGSRIAAAARAILDDPVVQERMVRELAQVRDALGPAGAVGRAAEMANRLLQGSLGRSAT